MRSSFSTALAAGAFALCSLGFSSGAHAQMPPEESAADTGTVAPVESAPAPREDDGKALSADEFEGNDGKRAKNTIYLELLGPGLLYSFNYERGISDFNIRVGVGGASWGSAGYMQIPVGFNYIGVGSDKHHLELGATANITVVFDGVGDSGSAVTFSPIVGYRLQSMGPGFNFRAGLSPIVAGFGGGVVGAGFLPWPYVSFGATF